PVGEAGFRRGDLLALLVHHRHDHARVERWGPSDVAKVSPDDDVGARLLLGVIGDLEPGASSSLRRLFLLLRRFGALLGSVLDVGVGQLDLGLRALAAGPRPIAGALPGPRAPP